MPKSTSASYSVDVSGFTKAMATANRALKLHKQEFTSVTAGLKNWQKSTEGIQAKLKLLSSTEDEYTKKLQAQKGILEATTKAYEKNAEKLTSLKAEKDKLKQAGDTESESYKELTRQIKIVESAMDAQSKKIDSTSYNIKSQEMAIQRVQNESKLWESNLQSLESELSEAEDSTEGMTEATEDMKKRGTGFFSELATGATRYIGDKLVGAISQGIQAVKGFVTESVEVGKEFKQSMSNVGAISGATASDMEKLEAKAREMGATTKFSATEASEAMGYMAMAGWKTQDMIAGIPGVMNLASASGEDLAQVSDILTDGLTAFGLSAKDSGHFADVLASASSNANTNVAMLGESFQYVAPVAGAVGYSVEDVATALGLMANSGIKASSAGTALRTAITNLSKPSAGAKKAMESLGISVSDANGKMVPLGELLPQLREKFAGLTEQQKIQTATTLFGKNAQAGMLSIINASKADYDKLSKAIGSCDGTAKKMADTMNDNLAGDSAIAKSAMQELQLTISDGFGPVLRVFVQKGTKWIEKLTRSFRVFSKSVNWDLIAKKVGVLIDKGFRQIEKFIKWLPQGISTIKKFTPLIVGIGTAFAGWKLSQPLSALQNILKVSKNGSNIFLALSTSLAGTEGGLSTFGSLMGKVGTQVSASGGFLKALPSLFKSVLSFIGPTGLIITAVSGLIGVLIALKKQQDAEWEATHKMSESYDEAKTAYEDLQSTMQDSADGYKSTLHGLTQNERATDGLIQKIEDLNSKESLSSIEKKKMAGYVDQLNTLYPDLNAEIDNETGKLKGNTAELRKNIEERKKRARIKAITERESELMGEVGLLEGQKTSFEQELQPLLIKYRDAKKAYEKAQKSFEEQVQKIARSDLDPTVQNRQIQELQSSLDLAKKEMDTALTQCGEVEKQLTSTNSDIIAKTVETLKIWQGEYKRSWGELQTTAKEQGIKVPQSVQEGLTEGTYLYPGDVQQLEQLLHLDEVIQKTKATGIQLPADFMQQIQSGAMEQKEVDNQLGAMLKLSEIEADAKNTGYHIPETMKREITNGKLKPAEALSQVSAEADKAYFRMATKSGQAGQSIDSKMSQGIISKKSTVSEAGAEVAKTISGQLSGAKKDAQTAGSQVGAGFATGISSKIQSVKDAVSSIGRGAIDLFAKIMDINSPSRVFADFGRYIDLGLAQGIEKNAKSVYGEIDTMARGMTSSLQRGTQGMTAPKLGITGVSGAQAQPQGITYVQTINSPVQLDLRELSRQTKNLLNQKGRR